MPRELLAGKQQDDGRDGASREVKILEQVHCLAWQHCSERETGERAGRANAQGSGAVGSHRTRANLRAVPVQARPLSPSCCYVLGDNPDSWRCCDVSRRLPKIPLPLNGLPSFSFWGQVKALLLHGARCSVH